MEKPKLVQIDPWLEPHAGKISWRTKQFSEKERLLASSSGSLENFALGHVYFGLHRKTDKWVFREWAPNAVSIHLIGDFNQWQIKDEFSLLKGQNGEWIIELPVDKVQHTQLYKLHIAWKGGSGDRIPSYANRVVQDDSTKSFSAQVWSPNEAYIWGNPSPVADIKAPLIYEAHVGMASEEQKVGSYREFADQVLPRIAGAGYNTLQLMAVQEHPYYGSFGYHVSNFFAASSRFGTPEDLKYLVDTAHGMGIAVIMDLVHSHSVKNVLEGLALFDGSPYQYFHTGPRREHVAWDSLCFDYGKNEIMHFLLSNCRYWLDEYQFDGFRFDGVTSMIYYDHGLSRDFTNYSFYFDEGEDEDAIIYLKLANKLIHQVKKNAITIAEDMSGMPGMAAPIEWGGLGFDYRLAMGVPDYWIKLTKDVPDEKWDMNQMYHELTTRRQAEKTIGYSESHDQALVGDKTLIFRLIDKEMYWHMNINSKNLIVDRGIAIHKLIRLATIATAGGGYLNFIGNEFGHPEWIDFPREGNNWSYQYARRQWSLVDNPELKYKFLYQFDRDMVQLIKDEQILEEPYCNFILANQHDQVLAFQRKELVFVFNFNPVKSFSDYGIPLKSGKYYIALNSDSADFGGFNLVDENMIYFTQRVGKQTSENPDYLKIYIPSRTALVFRPLVTVSVRNKLKK